MLKGHKLTKMPHARECRTEVGGAMIGVHCKEMMEASELQTLLETDRWTMIANFLASFGGVCSDQTPVSCLLSPDDSTADDAVHFDFTTEKLSDVGSGEAAATAATK